LAPRNPQRARRNQINQISPISPIQHHEGRHQEGINRDRLFDCLDIEAGRFQTWYKQTVKAEAALKQHFTQ
jgi:hypothetical protein